MDPDKYRLSDLASTEAYKLVYDFYAKDHPGLTFPRFAILSAQPGAGKSTVFYMVEDQFDPDKPPVHIDIDLTRPFNERLGEIAENDPFATAYYTNADSWIWTKNLLDDSKNARNNVIYETTLRSVSHIEDIIKAFRAEDYKVDLHALAVNSKISILGIHRRFEEGLALLEPARWTPIDFHDSCYGIFPQNVEHLDRSGQVELVRVYSRDGNVLYSNDKGPLKETARDAIEAERNRAWTTKEKESLVAGWKRIEVQVNARAPGKTKPDWYVQGIRSFLKEADLFLQSRDASAKETLDDGIIEATTHHHFFVRKADTGELISFDKSRTPAPLRPAAHGSLGSPSP